MALTVLNKPARLGLAAACLFVTVLTAAAQNGDPRIERVVLTESDGRLEVSFRVAGAFNQEKLNEAINAGLPATFTYKVELLEINAVLPAKTVTAVDYKRTIKYNPLSGWFAVYYGEGKSNVKNTDDHSQAQGLMTEINALPVAPITVLKAGQAYRLRVRAVVYKPETPPALWFLFLFAPPNIETDWYELEFKP